MWPPYFPNPPAPPKEPTKPPVQLGRCDICDQLTQRRCSSFGCAKFVCPRSECQRDHESEAMK